MILNKIIFREYNRMHSNNLIGICEKISVMNYSNEQRPRLFNKLNRLLLSGYSDEMKSAALQIACANEDPKLVHFLIQQNARCIAEHINQYIPLYIGNAALTHPLVQLTTLPILVRLLIDAGVNLEADAQWNIQAENCKFKGKIKDVLFERNINLFETARSPEITDKINQYNQTTVVASTLHFGRDTYFNSRIAQATSEHTQKSLAALEKACQYALLLIAAYCLYNDHYRNKENPNSVMTYVTLGGAFLLARMIFTMGNKKIEENQLVRNNRM